MLTNTDSDSTGWFASFESLLAWVPVLVSERISFIEANV